MATFNHPHLDKPFELNQELLKLILEPKSIEGITKEQYNLLVGINAVLEWAIEQLELALYCDVCGAKLHRACPNCTEWDFDRER